MVYVKIIMNPSICPRLSVPVPCPALADATADESAAKK